jgi:hypothetical protein
LKQREKRTQYSPKRFEKDMRTEGIFPSYKTTLGGCICEKLDASTELKMRRNEENVISNRVRAPVGEPIKLDT